MTLSTGGTPKVLVRLPNWLGDLMMAMPALRALRANLPTAELVAMARPGHRDLVGRITGLNGVLEAAPRSRRYRAEWAVVRVLRQRRFDLAVVLAPSFEAALTVWLAGIDVRIGQATDHRAVLLTRAVPVRAVHQSQAFLDVVAALDGAVKERAAGSRRAHPAAAGKRMPPRLRAAGAAVGRSLLREGRDVACGAAHLRQPCGHETPQGVVGRAVRDARRRAGGPLPGHSRRRASPSAL